MEPLHLETVYEMCCLIRTTAHCKGSHCGHADPVVYLGSGYMTKAVYCISQPTFLYEASVRVTPPPPISSIRPVDRFSPNLVWTLCRCRPLQCLNFKLYTIIHDNKNGCPNLRDGSDINATSCVVNSTFVKVILCKCQITRWRPCEMCLYLQSGDNWWSTGSRNAKKQTINTMTSFVRNSV
jgi:hypothetical protein